VTEPAPGPAHTRAAAALLVAGVVAGGRSLDDLLAGDPDQGAARGLKRSLAYGTLRWHYRLLAILRRLADRPPERLPPPLLALVEIGLFQLLSGETPPHAAVAETVEAARALGHARAAGFVNAVLRRFQREREAVLIEVDADLAARTAHPRWLVEALGRDRPGHVVSILEASNVHPPMWLRVNRRRWTLGDAGLALEAAGYAVSRHVLAPDALRIDPPADVRVLPGFAEGRLSVQDPAAQLAVELLGPRAGERVLDACAAPGGKACHVLERVDGQCRLTALDVSPERLGRVREGLARLGLEAEVRAGDATSPAGWWDGRPYDRILLDVPCSATGVIRRHPDIKLLRRAGDIAPLACRQAAMLESAWALLAPGGTLLYTSCSVLRAENEEVVGRFLAATPGARDDTRMRVAGWPARPAPADGPGYLLLPGQADTDGFYYACLLKSP
jgi:16S rRNA (cytosine967-C5)-methyltransferase